MECACNSCGENPYFRSLLINFLSSSSENKSSERQAWPDAEKGDGAEDDASHIQQEPLAADPTTSDWLRQQPERCGGTIGNTGQHQATAATDDGSSKPVKI